MQSELNGLNGAKLAPFNNVYRVGKAERRLYNTRGRRYNSFTAITAAARKAPGESDSNSKRIQEKPGEFINYE